MMSVDKYGNVQQKHFSARKQASQDLSDRSSG